MTRTRLVNAAIALTAALLIVLLRQGGYLARLENLATDARATVLRHEVASDIVIVGIDARSLAKLHAWPWPRRTHAQLLEQLRAASAGRVFVDIDFSSPSASVDDGLLQTELERWPGDSVILPTFVQAASGGDAALIATQPLPQFARHAQLAAVNQVVDADGLVRRFRGTWGMPGQPVESLASVIAAQASPAPAESLIDLSIAPSSLTFLSYSDVLNGDFVATDIGGKTVFVCATASELNDIIPVPQYRSLPGCVVQALEVQTLLAGALRSLPDELYSIALAAWAVLCVLAFSRYSWRRNLLLFTAALTLPVILSVAAYAANRVDLEMVPWLLVASISLAAITVRSLDQQTLRALSYALGLRRRNALMESIVESSLDGILCIDLEGKVCAANPAAARLFNVASTSLLGQQLSRYMPELEGQPDAFEETLNRLIEARATNADGRTFPVEYCVSRVGLQETPLFTVIVRDIGDRKAQERRLRYQAMHDSLTTLPNRAAMGEHLDRTLSLSKPGDQIAVMMLDLCRFKEVNDTLGHNAGDDVLREVAQRFRNAIGERGFLSRIGGDEFTVIVPCQPGDPLIESLARDLCATMHAPLHAGLDGSVAIDLGVSIGVAQFPQHADDAQTLLKNADVAMYVAKRRGSLFEYYDAAADGHSVRKLAMAAQLREAIANNSLQLYFQPQVNLHNGRVESAEALLRWPHHPHGETSPAEFVAVAEATDLIQPLTEWTLREALRHIVAWNAMGIELRVAVNLSARILQDTGFPERLRSQLDVAGVTASSLELEITESAMMQDVSRAMGVIRAIHALGVIVSVDDYGTGYSSLGYLRDLPLHALKLDKSFVLPMRERAEDRSIVDSTAQLAHALQLLVIAEGVETQWHAQALAASGYDYAQGHLYSPALPADAFIAWVRNHDVEATRTALTDVSAAA
jgi:diguanylate cyclase (GGDEF)-like protein/PAS domain S-box-containing protein